MSVTEQLFFRELKTIDELELALKFRYRIYNESKVLQQLINPNKQEIDISVYDLYAKHFAILNSANEPIAYLRMVYFNPQPSADEVVKIASRNKIALGEKLLQFPFLEHYPHVYWKNNFIKSCANFIEADKLAIHENYRKAADNMLHNLWLAVMAVYKTENYKVISSCTLGLEKYYKNYGFYRAHGSAKFVSKNLPPAALVVAENANGLASRFKKQFDAVVNEFAQSQTIAIKI
jgi:hypothetical protein